MVEMEKMVKNVEMVEKIVVKSKRSNLSKLKDLYPEAVVIDVTSKGGKKWSKLSPFYPWGIPVPGRVGDSYSVEGIWQGLKVFENEGVDVMSFRNNTMKALKRTSRANARGECLGHQLGDELLGYVEARKRIYVPCYEWMLENKCMDLLNEIKKLSESNLVVLLDYNTNEDVENAARPLSHASLIKRFIEEKMS